MLKPSEYQKAIYEWQERGSGDAFVSAAAGSGKTSTLVELANRLPLNVQQSAIFVAFNKHIAEELSKRLPRSVRAATIHSLGMQALRNHLRPRAGWKVESGKYSKLCRAYLQSNGVSRYDDRFDDAVNSMSDLVRYTMVTLTNPADMAALDRLCARYEIMLPFAEREIAGVATALNWGVGGMPGRDPKTGLSYSMDEAISFDDMIYLPNKLDLPVEQYSAIYVDEAQDLNQAQTELLLKMRRPGGRMIFCGDVRQAIYSFAGANSDSVERIIERTGAEVLPLNVCYRCPKSHLKLAQEIVPSIEPAPTAAEGVTGDMQREQLSSALRAGDLVLCRCTAPLISLVFELLAAGVAAKVRGRDIGASLVKIIDVIEKMPGYQWAEFAVHLDAYRSGMVASLSQREGAEMQIESLCDRIESIHAIYANLTGQGRCSNAGDLRSYIASLFDDSRAPVMLSTIHKCVHLDTLVETSDGVRMFRDIPESGFIAAPAGARPFSQKFVRGVGKALRITTKSGYTLTVSPEHGLTSWDQGDTRKEASVLRPGDLLRLRLGCTIDNQNRVRMPAKPVRDVRAVDCSIPVLMTGDLAEFLGLCVADGCLYRRGIRLKKRYISVVRRFSELLKTNFDLSVEVIHEEAISVFAAEVNSTLLSSWLCSVGGLCPNEKDVPDQILRSSLEIQARFLRGLFEDGTVNLRDSGTRVDHIHWDNTSRSVCEKVQVMLLRFGIISSVRERPNHANHSITTLYIYGQNARRFRDAIGFIADEKNARLQSTFGPEERYLIPVTRSELLSAKAWMTHQAYRNAQARGYVSRSTMDDVLSAAGDTLPVWRERSGWHYEAIRSIEEVECETGCVSVPDGERFLQNGFDGWNSKGLESDRVFILKYDLMPHPMAKSAEAIAQEHNLRYIALTRAKRELWFIIEQPAESPAASTQPALDLSPAIVPVVVSAPPAVDPAPVIVETYPAEVAARRQISQHLRSKAAEAVSVMPSISNITWRRAIYEAMLEAAERNVRAGLLPEAFPGLLKDDSTGATVQQLEARKQILDEQYKRRTSEIDAVFGKAR